MIDIPNETHPDDLAYPTGVMPVREFVLSRVPDEVEGSTVGVLYRLFGRRAIVENGNHSIVGEAVEHANCARFGVEAFSPILTVACGRVCEQCAQCPSALFFAYTHPNDGLICEGTGLNMYNENGPMSLIADARQVAREANRIDID